MPKIPIHKQKNFGKGNFKENPQNINKDGANKGSKWRKTLLKEILTTELTDNETALFANIKSRFPRFFEGSHEQNFQLFMELRQMQLVFSGDERVAQAAIKEIKDRLDGKALQKTELDSTVTLEDNAISSLPKDKQLTILQMIQDAKGSDTDE